MGVETMVSEDKRRYIEEMLRSGATWGQIKERCIRWMTRRWEFLGQSETMLF